MYLIVISGTNWTLYDKNKVLVGSGALASFDPRAFLKTLGVRYFVVS